MSIEENKDVVRRYFEAVSGKDKPIELVEKYVSGEGLKELIAFGETAFPRFELIAEDIIAEGDLVAVRATTKCIHKGDFLGIPGTGKHISQPFCIFYRIADGKIAEEWIGINRLEMMQQIGILPEDLSELVKND